MLLLDLTVNTNIFQPTIYGNVRWRHKALKKIRGETGQECIRTQMSAVHSSADNDRAVEAFGEVGVIG